MYLCTSAKPSMNIELASVQSIRSKKSNNRFGEILFVGALFIRFLCVFHRIGVKTAIARDLSRLNLFISVYNKRCLTSFTTAISKMKKREMVKIGSRLELQIFGARVQETPKLLFSNGWTVETSRGVAAEAVSFENSSNYMTKPQRRTIKCGWK